MIYILLGGVVLILILIVRFFSLNRSIKRTQNYHERLKPILKGQKPIVMIIVDSLMEKPLTEAMRSGRAPAFKFLSDQGKCFPKVVSSFPTMSVTIDSTLLTGTLPNQHHIFGLNYYHPKHKRIINLGTGARETIAIGLKRVLTDSLIHLNQLFLHPHAKTIHEEYDGPTASINAFIYRGAHQHTLHVPRLMRLFAGLPQQIKIKGPALFSLGVLHKINPKTRYDSFCLRYGGNDKFSTDELAFLIKKQLLPPFTIAYFPSNDDVVHRKGSTDIKGLEQADKTLQTILNSYPSWKEAIEQTTFILIGDSGQADTIADHQQSFVDMKEVLAPFQVTSVKRGRPVDGDQLVCCVNERMAYIYLLDANLSFVEVIKRLKQEKKIDLIAWKENDVFHVVSGNKDGILHFSTGGNHVDEYHQHWSIEGNLSILDISLQNDRISYGIYPDVLNRLMGVSETYDRVIIVTVAPGYEMILEQSPKHRGASHGSLHDSDSYVPMIVAGTDSEPKFLRIIDLKTWILDMLRQE